MSRESFPVNVAANGRLVLPAKLRSALGISGEGRVFFEYENGTVRLETTADRVKRAQDLFRKYAKNPGTVDEFIAEKRAEARREEGLE